MKSAGLLPPSKHACAGNIGTVLRPSPRPAALAGLGVVAAPHSWGAARPNGGPAMISTKTAKSKQTGTSKCATTPKGRGAARKKAGAANLEKRSTRRKTAEPSLPPAQGQQAATLPEALVPGRGRQHRRPTTGHWLADAHGGFLARRSHSGRRMQGPHRYPSARRHRWLTTASVPRNFVARSIRASPRKRAWSKSSTRCRRSARPAKPSSRARETRVGRPCQHL